MKKYIAYGSNLSKEQMALRCPNAKVFGVGYLPCTTLEFYNHATIMDSASESDRVPVVVWEIDEEDEKSLDRYEGVATGYYMQSEYTVHINRDVNDRENYDTTGMAYFMTDFYAVPPEKDYFYGIKKAYEDLGWIDEEETVLEGAFLRSINRYMALTNQFDQDK